MTDQSSNKQFNARLDMSVDFESKSKGKYTVKTINEKTNKKDLSTKSVELKNMLKKKTAFKHLPSV